LQDQRDTADDANTPAPPPPRGASDSADAPATREQSDDPSAQRLEGQAASRLSFRPQQIDTNQGYTIGAGSINGATQITERVDTLRQVFTTNTQTTAIARNNPTVVDWYRWQSPVLRDDRWMRGYWNQQRVQDRWVVYNQYPIAQRVGLTVWGVNALAYRFGYYNYTNPFFNQPIRIASGRTIDYSRPLIVYEVRTERQAAPSYQSQFERAQEAFRAGDYRTSLSSVEQAIAISPEDSALHEFRGLVLFAMQEYEAAAAPIYSVLAVRPGWDWATMRSFYPDDQAYTDQLRALEDYQAQNHRSAGASFLLAYHYLTLGHDSAAVEQLQHVLSLQERDVVAQILLDGLTGNETAREPVRNAGNIRAESLHGMWVSESSRSNSYQLNLKQDQSFEWTYSVDNKPQTIRGVYVIEGNTLAMEPDTGGVLLAELTAPTDNQFEFRMIGVPTEIPDSVITFQTRR
jgi:tetratricopeptide (TPR) repeat protein